MFKHLPALLKLVESQYRGAYTETFKDLDLWLDGSSNLSSADVEVEFDYEGPSYTDHPYGEGTAREYHGSQVELVAVRLLKDTEVYDDEGDQVVDTMKAGTDLMDQKWWKDSWSEWLADKIADKMDRSEPDFYEPDEYDRWG